ncbi:ABC transporter ATP-binding protein [Nocardioides sp. MAHUQ-72]|uniref:ABC transporter ATP-binding protein n=1 Tax=unclassified Nocardioides TaxID=2615069 RepID=UPI00362410DB
MTAHDETVAPTTQVQVTGLTVRFQPPRLSGRPTVVAVDDVSFGIGRGRTLGIAGESGSGKSTVARALMRITDPQAGSVRVGDREITALRGRSLRQFRREMQMVFQDPYDSLNPRLTVGDSVAEALTLRGLSRPDQRSATRDLFSRVGLPSSFTSRYPHQLSGGQRQRVSIARALAVEPRVIVCDEAVSALDVSVRAQILNLLKDLQEQDDLTYLFISHDLSTLRFIAEDVGIMYFGRMVEVGTREQVFGNPAHHYTQALIAAIPEPGAPRSRVRSRLQGEPPSHGSPPTGCPFNPRCPAAQDICRQVRPELTTAPGGQQVACHFPIPASTPSRPDALAETR